MIALELDFCDNVGNAQTHQQVTRKLVLVFVSTGTPLSGMTLNTAHLRDSTPQATVLVQEVNRTLVGSPEEPPRNMLLGNKFAVLIDEVEESLAEKGEVSDLQQ